VKAGSISSAIARALRVPVFYAQDYSMLSLESVLVLFSKHLYVEDTLEQMDQIGVGSVLIIVVALFCVGGVIVLNAASQFSRFGETVLTGDALSLSLVRELGPVFTALLVDAMRAMGIDPIRKLMTPRVLATVLIMPLIVAVGDCAGLLGGFLVASYTLHIDAQQFWTRAVKALAFGDLVIGFWKPVVFGFLVATVGCYRGFRVEGGTAGVGRATIMAFVDAALAVLIADLFLTRLLLYLFNKP
jgi:phospholipid/cholesterol/gamma-HCH transport system permease protein